ncbi:MAG: homoserine kinase [Minwuiales bacterium]|nr:homoserine kinase [Minwuiales bacterium]
MAVYTEVGDEELDDLVAQYDIGRVVSCKGIAEGVENSNFLLQTDVGTYILTLYEKRVDAADLPFFLGLMDHLAAAGIACPRPIHGSDGKALRSVAGRPAAIIEFLQGRWPRRPQPVHCAELGKAMAKLHLAAKDFPMRRANALTIADWRPLFDACKDRADEVHAGLAADLERELDTLEASWPTGLPDGVIHADLFPDNVFFLDNRLSGLIDFYFACNDFLCYDVAICLNAWCFETDGSFNVTKARVMLQAYREVREITESEYYTLPILARGSAMRFLLTRLYDWLNHPEGAFVQPKDPLEYYAKMRFHRAIIGPSAYGLDY